MKLGKKIVCFVFIGMGAVYLGKPLRAFTGLSGDEVLFFLCGVISLCSVGLEVADEMIKAIREKKS